MGASQEVFLGNRNGNHIRQFAIQLRCRLSDTRNSSTVGSFGAYVFAIYCQRDLVLRCVVIFCANTMIPCEILAKQRNAIIKCETLGGATEYCWLFRDKLSGPKTYLALRSLVPKLIEAGRQE